jgi:hypothetical protein
MLKLYGRMSLIIIDDIKEHKNYRIGWTKTLAVF